MKTAEKFYREYIDSRSIDVVGMASLTKAEVIEMMEAYAAQVQPKDVEVGRCNCGKGYPITICSKCRRIRQEELKK